MFSSDSAPLTDDASSGVAAKRPRTDDNTLVVCPIVYGSIANLLTGRKVDESATHRWTLYGNLCALYLYMALDQKF
jgi:hypothetical protein